MTMGRMGGWVKRITGQEGGERLRLRWKNRSPGTSVAEIFGDTVLFRCWNEISSSARKTALTDCGLVSLGSVNKRETGISGAPKRGKIQRHEGASSSPSRVLQ